MTLDSRRIPVSQLDDPALQALLGEAGIGRTVDEARKIAGFLGRDPAVTELRILGGDSTGGLLS